MRTRPATPTDLEAVVNLAAALFAEDGGTRDDGIDVSWPARDGRPYYSTLLGDERALLVVAEVPAVVGFLSGRLQAHDPLRPDAVNVELESMYVLAAARGRGVGRTLVEHFHRWADEAGATRRSVTAYAANDTALRFYRAFGYCDHAVTLGLQTPTRAASAPR